MVDAKGLRIVYMGTPDFAVAPLRRLVEGGYNVVGVVTMPDKPAGRGLKLQESAVKRYAAEAGLNVMQPEKLRSPEFVEQFRALDADLGIVIAFRMLPEIIWAAPRLGTFNLHASLLPQYRGAAPINWAIINGETKTGVTTFLLNHEIDKGDIIGQTEVAIGPDDNAGVLHDKLQKAGTGLVIDTVEKLASGNYTPVEQPQSSAELKGAPKIFKDDCRIDWNRDAGQIHDLIRGLSPYPAAWGLMCDKNCENPSVSGTAVKIYASHTERADHSDACGTILSDGRKYVKVACAGGYVCIDELQAAGKKRMTAEEFLRGFKNIDRFIFI